jgi:cyclopropane fatty-acyl-phospholipid synthase-like methyltransferase
MKNKDFFYLQYNKIDWKNQEKTKINSFINNHIIQNVILKHEGDKISIFDIGFGIGFFFQMLVPTLKGKYKNVLLEGCEPSKVNFDFFEQKKLEEEDISIKTHKETFQNVKTNNGFDFITAIYVFPHFLSEELEQIVQKIHSMLNEKGKFVLTVANQEYIERKLDREEDLFIEKRKIIYNGKQYSETLHYSDIPEIGKVVDYNREETYYLNLFKDNNFELASKEDINDNGFIGTLFVFEKK